MIKRQPGDVCPTEFNWKEQFDLKPEEIEYQPFIEFDVGKVRGLAIYAEELEADNTRLREALAAKPWEESDE